jgi:hypothetical protein
MVSAEVRMFLMRRATRSRLCAAGGESRWGVLLLPAAVLAAIAAQPVPSVAAQMDCASDSLTREDIARAQAVARPALPARVHLDITFACWNPDQAFAEVATRKTQTPEGVQQWWAVACHRDTSTWACDPPEFKQFIAVNLAVKDQSHAVALSFGQGIPVARARLLASRALSIYVDPTSRIRDCSSIEESGTGPVASHRSDKRASPAEPFHVNVIRDGLMDSVWLDDVDVKISFGAATKPAGEQSPCWQNVVIVD